MAFVGPGDQFPASGGVLDPVQRGVRNGELACALQRLAGREAMRDIENAAVGDDRHGFTGVLARDVFERSVHTGGEGIQALAVVGQGKVWVARLETAEMIRVAVLGFIEREALEMAVVALAQTRVVRLGQCVRVRDRCGGLPCAREIAAVQRRKMQACAREAARGGLCLAQPGFVEGDVDMPLQPALGVPGGFAVANQANPA